MKGSVLPNNDEDFWQCHFSSDSVISPLFRGLERAVSRTVVEGYGAFFIVLFLIIMPVFVILSVLRDTGIIGAIGRRSYEDTSWLSGVRNLYNR